MEPGIRRITVRPGISPPEMRELWRESARQAEDDAGTVIILEFPPGEFPMPDPGVFVYKNIPTPLQVSAPGIEVRFWLGNDGRLRIVTARHEESRMR